MIYALWVIAVAEVIRTTVDLRARKMLHLPKILKRNKPEHRVPRVTEMP